jgi:glutamyl-tRNA synthetase
MRLQVQEWAIRSEAFSASTFRQLQAPLEELDVHLTLRSYIIGYQINCADLLVWAILSSNHVALSWIRKSQNNVTRWYNFIESSNGWTKEALHEVQSTSSKEKVNARAATGAAGANYDIDIPHISGPIVTRFPPEPSGYLHIGHAKAALLNEYFARLKEDGTLICRFDDTNPSNESSEFQDSILADLRSIGIMPDKITYSSDNFQAMYDFAIKLIKDGNAFADDSGLGKGDEERRNRLPSKRRDMSIEETLLRFAEMKAGSEQGQRWALRARIAYDSPNGTLRDPVVYRCNMVPHHRTGNSWNIYPTYDFCAPILDSIEGVTLALRTNEYRDRNAQYAWIQEALGLRPVPIWDFSRLNLVRTVLSKRKLTRIVNEGRVWGWDDPRMPTIRGILRRGEDVTALREFILRQGPSRNVVNMQWDVFWTTNRKRIDPTAPRHTAVASVDAVPCVIQGVSETSSAEKPRHPKHPALGNKKVIFAPKVWLEQVDAVTFEVDEEITLMNWGNVIVRGIAKSTSGVIEGMDFELHLSGDFKKTKKKVTWLADATNNLVPVDLVSFDYLITKDKLEKGDEIEDYLTPVTEMRTVAYGDCNIAQLPRGTIVQFERKGFLKLDAAYQGDATRAVFFEVPTK